MFLTRSVAALVFLAPVLWAYGLPRVVAGKRLGLRALRVLFCAAARFFSTAPGATCRWPA